jgi:hypothetical protein
MILAVLSGTPLWVYALFAYLLQAGAQRLRSRRVGLGRLWAAPALFVAWGLAGLAGHPGPFAATLACWLLGAALGALIGRRLEPAPLFDHAGRQALLPASAVPLLRNLAIFGAHYLLHVAAALAWAPSLALMRWDAAVSGLGAGYFAGWALGLVRRRIAHGAAVAGAAR